MQWVCWPHTKLNWSCLSSSVLCLVAQSCPTLCDLMDYTPPGSSVLGILQARILKWVTMPSSWDLPNPASEPRSPVLQVDSFPSESPGKPKNTGVGSLSFLQGIFPTQESNWGLLHCRWLLYQLSYQGSFYSKIEMKVQRCPIYPLPPHMHNLPHNWHRSGEWYFIYIYIYIYIYIKQGRTHIDSS